MPPRKRKKASELEGDELLNYLLTDPSSKIGTMDINKLINEDTWYKLSSESRQSLCKLLPRNFFALHPPEVDWSHPSQPASRIPPGFISVCDSPLERYPIETSATDDTGASSSSSQLKMFPPPVSENLFLTEEEIAAGPMPAFMSNPHFRSACLAFQDHLAAGNMEAKQATNLEKFRVAITNGTRHVPWKDEAWKSEHKSSKPRSASTSHPFHPLMSNDLLCEGDIVSFTIPLTSPPTSAPSSVIQAGTSQAAQATLLTFDVLLIGINQLKSTSSLTFALPPLIDLSRLEHSTADHLHVAIAPRLVVPQIPPGISTRDAPNALLFDSSQFPPPNYIETLLEMEVRTVEELVGVITSKLPSSIRRRVPPEFTDPPPESPSIQKSSPPVPFMKHSRMATYADTPSKTSSSKATASSSQLTDDPPHIPDTSHFRLKSLRVHRWNTQFRQEMLPLWLEAVHDVGMDHSFETLGPRGGRTSVGSLFHMWCVAGG